MNKSYLCKRYYRHMLLYTVRLYWQAVVLHTGSRDWFSSLAITASLLSPY